MLLKEEFDQDDIQEIFTQVYNEFEDYQYDLDFDPYKVMKLVGWMDSRNRRALGKCIQSGGGERYRVVLNPAMLKFGEDGVNVIKDVIAHELCHTLDGCFNHGKQFHNKANQIKYLLGYNIDTKADIDASAYFDKYLPASKWMVKCDDCGTETHISRLSDPINNPRKYNCVRCGGNISSYKLNPSTGEYELYKSSDAPESFKYNFMCTDCDYVFGMNRRSKQYLNYMDMMKHHKTAKCPKCHNGVLYLKDNETIITPDTLWDYGSPASKLYDKLFTKKIYV